MYVCPFQYLGKAFYVFPSNELDEVSQPYFSLSNRNTKKQAIHIICIDVCHSHFVLFRHTLNLMFLFTFGEFSNVLYVIGLLKT